MSKFGQTLIESAREALAIAEGKESPARTISVVGPDVAAIRKRLGLSQDRFTKKFGLRPRRSATGNRGGGSPTLPPAIIYS